MLTICGEDNRFLFNISNIRLGFATNSSSTHSVVFAAGNLDDYEEYPLTARIVATDVNEDFCKITDPLHRLMIFAVSLMKALQPSLGFDAATIVTCSFCNISREALTRFHDTVSRRSISFAVPTVGLGQSDQNSNPTKIISETEETSRNRLATSTYCEAYLRELMAFLTGNKEVAWTVEHDSVSPDHGEDSVDIRNLLVTSVGYTGYDHSQDPRLMWVCRPDGDWWVLMNRHTGAKMRINFKSPSSVYEKATYPELVDIKITDYCPFDCSFCYQGSTKQGEHGDKETILRYITTLAAMGVFEIAIGGGEPTLHPNFGEILSHAYEVGIQPNFTTRNLAFFKYPENVQVIRDTGARFAVSVDNVSEARKAFEALKHLTLTVHSSRAPSKIFTFQVILGADPENVFEVLKYSNECRVDVTLLGYKTTGRGLADLTLNGKTLSSVTAAYEKGMGDLEAHFNKSYGNISIGVDTAAIEQLPFLKGEKYKHLVTPREGAFSMYIDAVSNKCGLSSYVQPGEFVDLRVIPEYESGNWVTLKTPFIGRWSPRFKQELFDDIAGAFKKW